jgi:DNA-binding MarR family transcriptional regulator
MPRTPIELAKNLHLASHAITNRIHHAFVDAGYDITVQQWRILDDLVECGCKKQFELADAGCKNKATITRVLEGMEERGLISRSVDKDDKRGRFVSLTKEGKSTYTKLKQLVQKAVQEVIPSIPISYIRHTTGALKTITKNAQEL